MHYHSGNLLPTIPTYSRLRRTLVHSPVPPLVLQYYRCNRYSAIPKLERMFDAGRVPGRVRFLRRERMGHNVREAQWIPAWTGSTPSFLHGERSWNEPQDLSDFSTHGSRGDPSRHLVAANLQIRGRSHNRNSACKRNAVPVLSRRGRVRLDLFPMRPCGRRREERRTDKPAARMPASCGNPVDKPWRIRE